MSESNQASPYALPPGFLGELANFIYAAAPRPVPEIALAGAIGLMAGIAGRAYNVNGAGLNLYMLLLAPTGSGKEAIASGVTALMKSIRQGVPAASEFIGPASIASPQALVKHLASTSPSFVSIIGEFGLAMQQMASPKAPAHLVGLRALMLDLYGKSGRNGELRPSIYSDREKNTAAVCSPAFSLIGESTPESFYEGLSERLVSDGLLPRFTTIEYRGKRQPLQECRIESPSPELIEKLATFCSHVLNLNSQNKSQDIMLSESAREIFIEFDVECDASINGAKNEVVRHLWNRAHIKALKLAGLVAIGCNYYNPNISPDIALWAIQIEKANVQNLLERFDAGEVGEQGLSETAQQNRVRAVITDWFVKPWAELQRYKIGTEAMRDNAIVPYSYISKRLTNDVAFKNAKNGASSTIKRSIDELFKCGEVSRISAAQLQKTHGTTMECYALTKPEQFLAAFKHEVKLVPKFF